MLRCMTSFGITARGALDHDSSWQILLQKSLMASANDDSLALTRFAVEAGDDGVGSITTSKGEMRAKEHLTLCAATRFA
jgi:hypothetical protein